MTDGRIFCITRWQTLLLLLFTAFFTASCTILSPPSSQPHYYLLQPAGDHECHTKSKMKRSPNDSIRIIIGPVSLPGYLDRSQIVQLADENRLRIFPTDLWGEPLDESIARILSLDLTKISKGKLQAEPFSARAFQRRHLSSIKQVLLKIYNFEAGPDGKCVLKGKWQLLNGQNAFKAIREEEVCIEAPLTSTSAEDSVRCMSTLIEKLSHDIFLAIIKVN